jgi:hypothetical protein
LLHQQVPAAMSTQKCLFTAYPSVLEYPTTSQLVISTLIDHRRATAARAATPDLIKQASL